MIIGPVIMQPTITEMPSPSVDDCKTLVIYADRLVNKLKDVIETLEEVSDAPDDGLIAIRQQADAMLTEAKSIQSNLRTIKKSASAGPVL